jgi:hypothetical protein
MSMLLTIAVRTRVATTLRAMAAAHEERVWQRVKIGLDREGDQCARTTHRNEDSDDPVLDRWPNLHRSRN